MYASRTAIRCAVILTSAMLMDGCQLLTTEPTVVTPPPEVSVIDAREAPLEVVRLVDTLPTDASLLERIRRENPCQANIPSTARPWEITFAPLDQCALVSLALATIRGSKTARQIIDSDQLLCVGTSSNVFRSAAEAPAWSLTFYDRADGLVYVKIDRMTGHATVVERQCAIHSVSNADICKDARLNGRQGRS